MTVARTVLDIWPFRTFAAPADLAALPVERLITAGVTGSARWRRVDDLGAVPDGAFAVQLAFSGDSVQVSEWDAYAARWKTARAVNWQAASYKDADQNPVVILEMTSVLTNNINTLDDISGRLKLILQRSLRRLAFARFASRFLGIAGIVILFFAIRAGVETGAVEVFSVVFWIAAATGMVAVWLRETSKSVAQRHSEMVNRQGTLEIAAKKETPNHGVNQYTQALKSIDRLQEEQASIFGFILLMVLIYFVSPLVILGVLAALFVGVILLLGIGDSREIVNAKARATRRFENATLSWRATLDVFSPPLLRRAKADVLRDASHRYSLVDAEYQAWQTRSMTRLTLVQALSFALVFMTYALALSLDSTQRLAAIGESINALSLFSVAPVIVLISAGKATAGVAQIIVRRLPSIRAG